MTTRRPATIAAHTVRAPSPESLPEGARGTPSAEPLYQTSVFDFETIEDSDAPLAGTAGYVYARYGLPNPRSLELTVAALESAEDAVATSSGMAAIACTLLAAAKAGDRVLVQRDGYGGTLALVAKDFGKFGVTCEAVDAYDLAAVERALAKPTRMLICETLSNPLIHETNLAELAKLCRSRDALLVVDNTFASPVFKRPLVEGADVVVHSATKFLGGHHDLCAGVLAGRAAFVADARAAAKRFGMTAAPFDAWLACRGIRTLDVRVRRAAETAKSLAAWLREDRRVRAVHFPGWGAMLSFDVGDFAAASRFVAALELVTLTPSLGGTTSTVSHAATSSHRGFTAQDRRALGIGDGLLRLSVGLEDALDLRADLDAALAAR